jgi:hypothetical protein
MLVEVAYMLCDCAFKLSRALWVHTFKLNIPFFGTVLKNAGSACEPFLCLHKYTRSRRCSQRPVTFPTEIILLFAAILAGSASQPLVRLYK